MWCRAQCGKMGRERDRERRVSSNVHINSNLIDGKSSIPNADHRPGRAVLLWAGSCVMVSVSIASTHPVGTGPVAEQRSTCSTMVIKIARQ